MWEVDVKTEVEVDVKLVLRSMWELDVKTMLRSMWEVDVKTEVGLDVKLVLRSMWRSMCWPACGLVRGPC